MPQDTSTSDTTQGGQLQWFQTTGVDGKVYKTQAKSAQEAMQKFAPYKQPKSASTASAGAPQATPQGQPYRGPVKAAQPDFQIPKNYGFTNKNVAQSVFHGAEGLVRGGVEMAQDIARNPNWFTGPTSTAQKFVYGPADAEVVKARKAYHEGRYYEAFGHGAASLIPLMGPWLAHIGERAGSGDIGGALGEGAGVVGTGGLVKLGADKAGDYVDPTKLREKAAELNTKVLKQADTTKVDYKTSAGLQVAQEHIIGTMRDLPVKIESARVAKAQQVAKMAQAADQAGVTIDITKDIAPIIQDIATVANTRGQWTPQLRNQVGSLIDRITTQTDLRTGAKIPRPLNKLTVTQTLALEKGLEDLSAFGKDVPETINNIARRLRQVMNDKLPKPIQDARAAESRLITARDAARENFVKVLNDKNTIGRGVLYGSASTLGAYLALRGMGTMPMVAIGTVILLRAMAASAVSRTMRAALYARAADFIDRATMANAGPPGTAITGPTGSAITGPNAPQGGPTLTGQTGAPFADATVVQQNDAPAGYVRGTKLPASATRARAGSGDYVKGAEKTKTVKPKYDYQQLHREVVDEVPKSAMHAKQLKKMKAELERALSGKATKKEMRVINKHIRDRMALREKNQQAASQATTSQESAAKGLPAEQRMILLEQGYSKLASYEGGPQMVKSLRDTAKAMQKVDPNYDEVMKLAEALQILQSMPKE